MAALAATGNARLRFWRIDAPALAILPARLRILWFCGEGSPCRVAVY